MDVEGSWGNVCFLSRAKETLKVNLMPKMINFTPKQMVPCLLPIHTIPKMLE